MSFFGSVPPQSLHLVERRLANSAVFLGKGDQVRASRPSPAVYQ